MDSIRLGEKAVCGGIVVGIAGAVVGVAGVVGDRSVGSDLRFHFTSFRFSIDFD